MDDKKFTISVAESITGAYLTSCFTRVKGSSKYFIGSITSYCLDMKVKLLGVNRDMASECNCVSEEVAKQMAKGVSEQMSSDIGIATCGYASSMSNISHELVSQYKDHIKVNDLPYAYICLYDNRDGIPDGERYKVKYFSDANSSQGFNRETFIQLVSHHAYMMVLNYD